MFIECLLCTGLGTEDSAVTKTESLLSQSSHSIGGGATNKQVSVEYVRWCKMRQNELTEDQCLGRCFLHKAAEAGRKESRCVAISEKAVRGRRKGRCCTLGSRGPRAWLEQSQGAKEEVSPSGRKGTAHKGPLGLAKEFGFPCK